jgi:hypothetical protein
MKNRRRCKSSLFWVLGGQIRAKIFIFGVYKLKIVIFKDSEGFESFFKNRSDPYFWLKPLILAILSKKATFWKTGFFSQNSQKGSFLAYFWDFLRWTEPLWLLYKALNLRRFFSFVSNLACWKFQKCQNSKKSNFWHSKSASFLGVKKI